MDITQKLEVEGYKVIEAGQMMVKGDLVSMAKAKSILEYVVKELNKENPMMTIEKMKEVIKEVGETKDFENLEVGQMFEVNGEMLVVDTGKSCADCCLSWDMCKTVKKPYCTQAMRKDLMDVVFKRVDL